MTPLSLVFMSHSLAVISDPSDFTAMLKKEEMLKGTKKKSFYWYVYDQVLGHSANGGF